MYTCTICHFATELDDVVAAFAMGGCICLRCFARETGTALGMPRVLRLEISAALAALEAA